jgi:hypothetical protein
LREREAKFIGHSTLSYEMRGLGWWLPLLDKELLWFWERTDLSCKEHECYFRSVERLTRELIGDDQEIELLSDLSRATMSTPAPSAPEGTSLPDRFGRMRHGKFANHLLYELGYFRQREYEESNLGFFGLVDKRTFMSIYTGRENINSFIALELLVEHFDARRLSKEERELFASIPIFKSNLLKYLQKHAVRR